MTTITVRVEAEHLRAVERALQALKTDQVLLEHWGNHSTELALAIDDLEELRDRIVFARDEDREARSPFGNEHWSKRASLRVVS